jgi:sulfate permease, SulP family
MVDVLRLRESIHIITLAFNVKNYSWRIARNDLIAGATVAAIAVPQAIAYALIAGVDPRFGLYSAVIVTIVASILGSSSHLINGPTNAISLVIFSALASFQGPFDTYQALFLLGITVGIIQILVAVFKLGDLTRYVSESVILGFMAGAGFLIALGQIGNFVGAAKKGKGDESVLFQTWETLSQGWPYNFFAIGLGVGTLAVVLLLRGPINRYKLPRIDMLSGLVLASVIAAYFGWSIPLPSGKTIVAVVGTVPAALPGFYIPHFNLEWFHRLITGAIAISLLGLLEALAVAKSISTYTRQPLDYNRQCLAEGVGNLVGGFFQSMPGSGSLTRSAINYQAGAVTRASGIYSGIIVAIVVLLGGPYTRFIPTPALAALLFITAYRLVDWKRLFYALRASRFDAILVVVTAFSAVFISVDHSILIGVALSIILFVPRASRLAMRELIVTLEGVVRERHEGEIRPRSLLIYDLEGELFFGAAPEVDRYLTEILDETDKSGIKYVVLRLRRTRNPDVVAVEHMEHFLREARRRKVTVLLAGLKPELVKILNNISVTKWIPVEHLFPEEGEIYSATLRAVRHAQYLIGKDAQSDGIETPLEIETVPAYYLV